MLSIWLIALVQSLGKSLVFQLPESPLADLLRRTSPVTVWSVRVVPNLLRLKLMSIDLSFKHMVLSGCVVMLCKDYVIF